MQYSFAVAALVAGASAHSSYPVAASSSAPVAETKSYPVVAESKSTAAVQTSSAPAATYPVAAPNNNGTTMASQVVKYTTEIVNQYTTYCPGPTQITHGTKTYTVTAPTTLTITDCPCTVSKPVYTTSVVQCNGASCSGKPAPPPTYNNGTVPVVPGKPTQEAPVPAPTGGYPTKPTQATTPGAPIPTAGAGKVAAFGGLLGLAAFVAL
ncbi:Mmc protein [Apiospora rasikravindrae]|uniref:Mmc protein n=1 Tax=Apiospora rasikravindrae TaxID=990691 RepID=A0ABR1T947_9PEZI